MGIHTREITYHTPDVLPEEVNPWMNQDITDFLYHLGFDNHGNGLEGDEFEGRTLQEIFGDVTHVCMGGSPDRVEKLILNYLRRVQAI